MKSYLSLVLAACVLASGGGAARQQAAAPSCDVDRAHLLALDETRFDQDMAGGWRELSSRPGCTLAAADLLRDYRQAHRSEGGLLAWHEAQLRAFEGQSKEAIVLMEAARNPAQADRAGWNLYVDATIAFLRKDRPALERARQALALVPAPVGEGIPPVRDGYMEVDFADGQKRRIRWPPNIDVVEGLLHCFDRPYADAYADACRVRPQ
jgi:hypothetical protein